MKIKSCSKTLLWIMVGMAVGSVHGETKFPLSSIPNMSLRGLASLGNDLWRKRERLRGRGRDYGIVRDICREELGEEREIFRAFSILQPWTLQFSIHRCLVFPSLSTMLILNSPLKVKHNGGVTKNSFWTQARSKRAKIGAKCSTISSVSNSRLSSHLPPPSLHHPNPSGSLLPHQSSPRATGIRLAAPKSCMDCQWGGGS